MLHKHGREIFRYVLGDPVLHTTTKEIRAANEKFISEGFFSLRKCERRRPTDVFDLTSKARRLKVGGAMMKRGGSEEPHVAAGIFGISDNPTKLRISLVLIFPLSF